MYESVIVDKNKELIDQQEKICEHDERIATLVGENGCDPTANLELQELKKDYDELVTQHSDERS